MSPLTFVNIFHEAFDAVYVNQNNHRKHAKRSNNRVSLPTRVFGRVRTDSNVSWILRTRQPHVIRVDISR